jgi:hypothetical protein
LLKPPRHLKLLLQKLLLRLLRKLLLLRPLKPPRHLKLLLLKLLKLLSNTSSAHI